MNVEWWDCAQPQAAEVQLTLPNGGGQLMVPYVFAAVQSPACGLAAAPTSGLSRGPLSPGGVSWVPQFVPLSIRIAAPAAVARGTTLVYRVTLTNLGDEDYLLDPCPDYYELLGAKEALAEYQLNCSVAVRIPPRKSLVFEMKMQVPKTMRAGRTTLSWTLNDPRLETPYAMTPVQLD